MQLSKTHFIHILGLGILESVFILHFIPIPKTRSFRQQLAFKPKTEWPMVEHTMVSFRVPLLVRRGREKKSKTTNT